jgi:hypothetical protein
VKRALAGFLNLPGLRPAWWLLFVLRAMSRADVLLIRRGRKLCWHCKGAGLQVTSLEAACGYGSEEVSLCWDCNGVGLEPLPALPTCHHHPTDPYR